MSLTFFLTFFPNRLIVVVDHNELLIHHLQLQRIIFESFKVHVLYVTIAVCNWPIQTGHASLQRLHWAEDGACCGVPAAVILKDGTPISDNQSNFVQVARHTQQEKQPMARNKGMRGSGRLYVRSHEVDASPASPDRFKLMSPVICSMISSLTSGRSLEHSILGVTLANRVLSIQSLTVFSCKRTGRYEGLLA